MSFGSSVNGRFVAEKRTNHAGPRRERGGVPLGRARLQLTAPKARKSIAQAGVRCADEGLGFGQLGAQSTESARQDADKSRKAGGISSDAAGH